MESLNEILTRKFVPNTLNSETEVCEICEICGESIKKRIEISWINRNLTASVSCACERKKIADGEKHKRQQEKFQKVEKLKKLSLLGKRYENVNFESSELGLNPTFDLAFERCKKYCEIHTEVFENGMGIYLFGDKGVGKTHITACMANALLKKCVPVLLTNLFEISKALKLTFRKESFETEQILFDRFSNIDFLFFDDLGTEIFSKKESDTWLQTLLFDLINTRYNAKKPTIFSSNYSLNELVNFREISEKTVDRITEMSKGAIIKIKGESFRNRNFIKKMPF